ncbi:hypothetical protein AHAS_Ahas01G0030200 [Arachis hypogaea]
MVLGLGTGSAAASSLPSSVISSPPANSLTSSASLPPSALRNRYVLSEFRFLSSTTILASISSSTVPMRWTRPQPCKRPRQRSSLLKATFDKFIVVVDKTKLVLGLGGATLRCRRGGTVLQKVQSGSVSRVVQGRKSGGARAVFEQLQKYIKKSI